MTEEKACRKNSLFSSPACWTADKRDQRRCSSESAVCCLVGFSWACDESGVR